MGTFEERTGTVAAWAVKEASDLDTKELDRQLSWWRRFLTTPSGQWTTLHAGWWLLTASFWLPWSTMVLASGNAGTWWAVVATVAAGVVSFGTAFANFVIWVTDDESDNDPFGVADWVRKYHSSGRGFALLMDVEESTARIKRAGAQRSSRRRARLTVREVKRLARIDEALGLSVTRIARADVPREVLEAAKERHSTNWQEMAQLAVLLEDLAEAEEASAVQRIARREIASLEQSSPRGALSTARILQEEVSGRRAFVEAESQVTGVRPHWK